MHPNCNWQVVNKLANWLLAIELVDFMNVINEAL